MAVETSGAKAGIGTILQRGQGTDPETYVDIGEVTDLKLDGISVDVKERTHFGSPYGFKEKLGVLADGGTITAELNFRPDDATQSALWTDAATVPQEPRAFKIVFGQPDDPLGTLSFNAVVSKVPVNVPHGDIITGSVTFEISGKPILE